MRVSYETIIVITQNQSFAKFSLYIFLSDIFSGVKHLQKINLNDFFDKI